MSATLLNSTIILNDILALLRTKCVALQTINRQYDSKFANNVNLKPGTSLSVRKPIQVVIRSGKKLDVQDTVEESVDITCTTQLGVDLPAFTSEQLTMNISDFRERYLKPSASRIAAEIDKLVLQEAALGYNNNVGTPGTTPATSTVLMQGSQKLTENNAMDDSRYAIVQPAANTALVAALQGLYNDKQVISNQWKTGMLKSSLGLDIGISNNLHRITCGTRVGTIVVDDAGGTGLVEGMATIHVDGFTNATDTWKEGEKFTIAAVYSVSPETKITTANLMQFTVAADFTAASNEGDLTFTPAIRSTGARQNVDALPLTEAALTPVGTASTSYPMNIVHQKDAIALVTADLPKPRGVHDCERNVLDGVSMRYITDYDGKNDEFFSRFDMFYGITVLRQELGCVLWG